MRRGRVGFAALLLAPVVLAVPRAEGATSSVACSWPALRDAVGIAMQTPEDDVLRLAAPCVYAASDTLTVLPGSGSLTLRGGVGTVLDGQNARRIMRVDDGATAELQNLVLRRGRGPVDGNQERGGAVRNTGSLRVADSHFIDNVGGRVGGAIDSTVGSLTVVRSLFTGNRAENGGAIYAEGSLTVVSTTFTQNDGIGSAILSFATGAVSSSTFVGNVGQSLHQDTKLLSLVNSVFAGNSRACAVTGGGTLRDLGGNVEDQAGTCTFTDPSSRSSLDSRLLPLADNGGVTRSFAPGPGSPLLDRGARCTEGGPAVFDQRLRPRPTTGCDIGAVESEAAGSLAGDGGFGSVKVGSRLRRTFALTSTGNDVLRVGAVTVTGGDYTLVQDGCSGRILAKSAICSAVVELTPSGAGAKTGQLAIVDNGDADPRRVALTGTARATGVSPAPAPASVASPGPQSPSPSPGPAPSGSSTPTPAGSPSPSLSPGGSPPPTSAPVVEPPRLVMLADGDTLLLSQQRAAFPQALLPPGSVSLELDDLTRSAWLAALLLFLLGFPVGLVNDTLGAHREDVMAWFAPLRARLGRLRPPERVYTGLPTTIGLPAAALVSAVVYGFLSPGFRFDRASAASVIGLVLTVVITGLVSRETKLLYLRRSHGVAASLRLQPGFIGLAVICTIISRLTGLQPGLVLGSVLGVQLSRGLRWREEGRAIVVSSLALLATSMGAWFAWAPVSAAAAQERPSFVVLVLDVVLAALFVIGVEALTFGLVPLRFLDGHALWRFSKRWWGLLAGIGAFGFVHVVLHPTDSAVDFVDRERYLAAMLAVYCAAAVAFWSYFRRRADKQSQGVVPAEG